MSAKKKSSDQILLNIEENNFETLALVSKGKASAEVKFYKSNDNGVIDYFRGGSEHGELAFTFRSFAFNAENDIFKRLEIVSQVAIGSVPTSFLVINKVKNSNNEPEAVYNRKKQLIENHISEKKDQFKFYEKESGHRFAAMAGCNFLVVPNSFRVGAFSEYMSTAYTANCKEYNLKSISSIKLYGMGAFAEKTFLENTFALNARAKGSVVFQNNYLKTATVKKDIIFEVTGLGKVRSFKPYKWLKTPELAISFSQFLNTKKIELKDFRINFSLGYTFNF